MSFKQKIQDRIKVLEAECALHKSYSHYTAMAHIQIQISELKLALEIYDQDLAERRQSDIDLSANVETEVDRRQFIWDSHTAD